MTTTSEEKLIYKPSQLYQSTPFNHSTHVPSSYQPTNNLPTLFQKLQFPSSPTDNDTSLASSHAQHPQATIIQLIPNYNVQNACYSTIKFGLILTNHRSLEWNMDHLSTTTLTMWWQGPYTTSHYCSMRWFMVDTVQELKIKKLFSCV